jgi:hypothetical protein
VAATEDTSLEPVSAERSSEVRDLAAGTAVGMGAPALAVFAPGLGVIAIPAWLACMVLGMYLMERSEGHRWIGKGLVWGASTFLLLGGLWIISFSMTTA